MLDHFCELGPKAWWIIIVGFSHDALDKDNLTQTQEGCLQLDHRALYYLMCALHDDVFRRVWDLESAHNMWMALQAFYGDSSMPMGPTLPMVVKDVAGSTSVVPRQGTLKALVWFW